MTEQPSPLFILAEAAAHLRLTNRAVAKIAKRHGLCMITGRTMLLSEADIQAIKDVLRVAPAEPKRPPPMLALSDHALHQSLKKLSRKSRKQPPK